jgi:serine/threonine protein kinase
VTRDPQSNEYAIVTEFRNGGNLREMIKKNHSNLTWNKIIDVLINISDGLHNIHNQNYHHKDFHSGNILNEIGKGNNFIFSVISDFGLCCPANQSSADKALYGVLPFVAPEVLRGEEFTKAADIYGFGMLMSEVISGEAPFIDRDYDLHLALDICKGERPQIPEYAPEPYVILMKRCWNPIPSNRPTSLDLYQHFDKWYNIIMLDVKDNLLEIEQEIERAFSKEREDKWKAQLVELAANSRPLKKSQNLLTSKRLDYSKHLSQLLKNNDKAETSDDGMLFLMQ